MKSITAFVAALMLLPTIGFGAGELSILSSMDPMSQMEQEDGPSPECANFSGHWKGACVTNEGVQLGEEIQIDQKGCGGLRAHSKKMHAFIAIGGTVGANAALPPRTGCTGCGGAALSHGMESHWNKEMNVLTINAGGHMKPLALTGVPRGHRARIEIKLVDKFLVVEAKSNSSQEPHVKSCKFEKAS